MNKLLTLLPFGLAGKIYRSSLPYSDFDPDQVIFDNYQQVGVDVVVMLVSDGEAQKKTGRDLRALYRQNGMDVIYLPIPDFNVPISKALLESLEATLAAAVSGRNVAVHCNAGIGRTGLFMACLARRVFGLPGDQAIQWVQQYIEHAVENELQYSFVQDLAFE